MYRGNIYLLSSQLDFLFDILFLFHYSILDYGTCIFLLNHFNKQLAEKKQKTRMKLQTFFLFSGSKHLSLCFLQKLRDFVC